MRISEAAKQAGTPASALRYYEKVGLVGATDRCGLPGLRSSDPGPPRVRAGRQAPRVAATADP
ncbi:MAG: MerR family DNA-binding transcriptional regulator [Solirubrobacteraceae bacterium]